MIRKSTIIMFVLMILVACQPHKSTYVENHESKLLPLLVQSEDLDGKNKWKSILISQQTFSPPKNEETEEAYIILDGFSADKHPLYVEHGLSCYKSSTSLSDIDFLNIGTSRLVEIGQESVFSCDESLMRDSRILSCTLGVGYKNLISHIIVRLDIPQSENYSYSYLIDIVNELGLLVDNRISNGEFCVD